MKTLETERLLLRPLALSDAADVQRLAGDARVAATTLNVPHPYPDGAAEAWIQSRREAAELGTGYTFALVRKEDDALMGCVAVNVAQVHRRAELAYWIGVPYWGHGYATEASQAVVRFAFAELGLNRVFARYMTHNPASGKVMQKLGMRPEGVFRQEIIKDGQFVDVAYYGLLRSEYQG